MKRFRLQSKARFGPWGSGKRFGAEIITRPAAVKQEALLQAGLSATRRRRQRQEALRSQKPEKSKRRGARKRSFPANWVRFTALRLVPTVHRPAAGTAKGGRFI